MRKRVPLADRLVGLDERPLAGIVGVVVPQRSGAASRAVAHFARVVHVPDLHLRIAAEIDAGIAVVVDHQPVHVHLEIAVVLGGGEVDALSVGNNLALCGIDLPVQVALGVPLGLFGGEFLLGKERLGVRAVGALASAPAGEVLAVEQRREAGGRMIERAVLGKGGHRQKDRDRYEAEWFHRS